MKIKDILTKVSKGEQLTDDEKKALAEFDPDATAAAARRKAEQDADTLKADKEALAKQLADLNAKIADMDKGKMTEAQKAEAEKADLKKAIADLQQKFADKDAESKKLARAAKVTGLIQKSGIKFVDGVDAEILSNALAGTLAGVPDDKLDAEDVVKPLLEGFRAKNKAVILDTTGHGAGTDPARKIEVGSDGKPVDKMSADERAADLKKRGII